jgi:Glycosyl transferases group 1
LRAVTRVLYVDHPEGDFQSAIVFTGLCQVLGPENVVDYPYKKSFHGLMHNYPSPYAVSIPGVLPWQRPASDAPGAMGSTGPFDWMAAQPGREWPKEEVVSRLREFDLVILASPRAYNEVALADLIETVGRPNLPPLVMMDGEDYSQIRTDLVQKFQPKVYFKRELLPGSGAGCQLEPFPFASPVFEPIVEVPKDIDVLFLGGNTWPGRGEAIEALQKAFGDKFVGGFRGHVSHREYLNLFARARVAISVRGFGHDTLKFWEIPSVPGTLLVADVLPIIKPNPFTHGVNALYFDSSKELVECVRCALEDETWRARVATAGNEHLQKFHTARARAASLLRISLGKDF